MEIDIINELNNCSGQLVGGLIFCGAILCLICNFFADLMSIFTSWAYSKIREHVNTKKGDKNNV